MVNSSSAWQLTLFYGEVPEWPKGADCKSVGSAFEGSNPSLPKAFSLKQGKGFFFRLFLFLFVAYNDIGRDMTEDIFYKDGLRFECQRCSACCRFDPGYVFISKNDLENMSSHFKLSEKDFLEKYCRVIDLGITKRISLNEKKNYDCIFWENDGCSVYGIRPVQCRTFPFWSSFLGSIDEWKELGKSCPGIDKGSVVSYEEIEDRVKQRQNEKLLTV